MNANLTEVVFILDRSGSMHGMESDTVGGFNSVIEKYRAESGEVLVSTILFNTIQVTLHDRLPVSDIPAMTVADFSVGGCTALMDTLGSAIDHIDMIHRYIRPEDVPAHTIFVIMTDGMENASHRYSADQVRSLVSEHKENAGWDFIFLAANIDAAETAARYGISREMAVDYHNDSVSAPIMYDAIASATLGIHRTGKPDSSWRHGLDDDFRSR